MITEGLLCLDRVFPALDKLRDGGISLLIPFVEWLFAFNLDLAFGFRLDAWLFNCLVMFIKFMVDTFIFVFSRKGLSSILFYLLSLRQSLLPNQTTFEVFYDL